MNELLNTIKTSLSTRKSHPTNPTLSSQQYILLTYRTGIQKIFSSTYYQSDRGWGCMLRVGQMFIANLYYKIQHKSSTQIIRLFYDNKPMIFSLPMITDVACIFYPKKKEYQWFSPCQVGFVVKDLLDRFDYHYRTTVCIDNSIFYDDILRDRPMVILMVMCRIGLDKPQSEFLKCLTALTKNPYFNCIMGGTPKRAHLFMKHEAGYFGYLDPHITQKVPKYQKLEKYEKQYISKLIWIKQQYIDTSMSIVFVMPEKDVDIFWANMLNTKEKFGSDFFLYLDKERPEVGDGIEVMDIDEMLEMQVKQSKAPQLSKNKKK